MFVFVYSSYHLKLSFPHLVVILRTLKTHKNIFCFNNNAAGMRGYYHKSSDCFEYPKKSQLKSSHPKKYLPNFLTQKNPGIENFKPKKILRSSPSLEIQSTPPGVNSPGLKLFDVVPGIFCRMLNGCQTPNWLWCLVIRVRKLSESGST